MAITPLFAIVHTTPSDFGTLLDFLNPWEHRRDAYLEWLNASTRSSACFGAWE